MLQAGGATTAIDFFAAVPGIARVVEAGLGPVPVEVLFGTATQTFHVGPQSCAVPGFVPGVLHLHQRFGRLPRHVVLEPAIEMATRGVVITEEQEYCQLLLAAILSRTEASRTVFRPHGERLAVGETCHQPGLADTMRLLADVGAAAVTTGELASEITAWSHSNDGLISAEDLAAYRVREYPTVSRRFGHFDLVSVPPPSSGGALVAYAMAIVELLRQGDEPIDAGTTDGCLRLVAAMRSANDRRGRAFDQRLYGGGLVEWLLDEDTIQSGLRDAQALVRIGAAARLDPEGSGWGSTTHISAIDCDGNAVSMTTSTGCGSGEFVGTTGIHLNNMLGEEDLVPVEHTLHSGDRLTSMMAPSLVLYDGNPVLASGSAGSNRLRSAIVQTALRLLESRRLNPGVSLRNRVAAAVAAPRVHVEGGAVHAEPGSNDEALKHLRAAGMTVDEWPSTNMFFGGVNMVAVNDRGEFAASGDPRRGGAGCVVEADGSLTPS